MRLRMLKVSALLVFSMGLVSGPAQAACSNPAGNAGDIVFNKDFRVLQYCNDTSWQAVGPSAGGIKGPTDGLIGYWTLDDLSDTTIEDELGWVDGTLTATGTYSSAQGRINGAIHQESQAVYTQFPSTAFPETFTVSMWIKPDPQGTGLVGLMSNAFNSPSDGFRIFFNNVGTENKRIIVETSNASSQSDGGSSATGVIVDDQWNHVVLAVDRPNGQLTIYHDGADVTTNSTIRNDFNLNRAWAFGCFRNAGNTCFEGLMDEVRIYNKLLTQAEVLQLYEATKTTIVPDGLIGHWKLDETSGSTIIDYASSNNGTVQGGLDPATDSVPGRVGTALEFDGAGDYVQIPPSSTLNLTELSIAFWINPPAYPVSKDQAIIENRVDNGTNVNYSIGFPDLGGVEKVMRGGHYNGGWQNSENNTELSLNVWQHIVLTIDNAGTKTWYYNGVFDGSDPGPPLIIYPGSDLIIGYSKDTTFNNSFEGILDDVRIYNRVLSADEARKLYEARDANLRYNADARVPEYFNSDQWVPAGPVKPTTTGLVGHWKLDEDSGTFADSSGNGNDGTQSGGVSYASAGVIGNAAGFDGVDDYISAGSGTSVADVFVGGGSVSAWFKADSWGENGYGRIVDKGTINEVASDGWGIFVCDDNGTHCQDSLSFFVLDTDSVAAQYGWWSGNDNSITLGQWHHVVVTYTAGSAANDPKIFIDGVEQTIFESVTPLGATFESDAANTLTIGNRLRSGSDDRWFDGAIDDVRIYNRALSADEIADLYAAHPTDPCDPKNNPAPGQTCDDGSVYAGISPDGNEHMYTTPADAPSLITWNDGSTNHLDMSMANCTDTSPGTAATCQTGEANTAFLVGATSQPDYPFAAAEYCDGLSAHGYDDWYLPAQDELNVLYTNKNAGDLNGTFNETGSYPAGYYWTSSEYSFNRVKGPNFSTGSQGISDKDNSLSVRCTRKGYVPSCASPERKQGSIVYNADQNVMQYCDGENWQAMWR